MFKSLIEVLATINETQVFMYDKIQLYCHAYRDLHHSIVVIHETLYMNMKQYLHMLK